MTDYNIEDVDRIKFAINMACFYLPPAQEDIKIRLQEVHSFFDKLILEGYFD